MLEAAGRRIAVLGVLSPRYSTEKLAVDPPDQAILSTLGELKVRPDAVVVLAYLPEEELLELAGRLPEVDLVVGGPTGQNIPPRRVGPALVASATNQGKFLAEFQAPAKGSQESWQGTLVEMTGTYADDPGQSDNLRAFYDRLADLDLPAEETSFVSLLPGDVPAGFHVAGTHACRDCHAEACEAWDKSYHALAWQSLVKTGAQVDSDCQRCHATAYGLPGGFLSRNRTPQRQHVGCESCHGPSLAHADEPQIPTAYFKQAASQCEKCHDPENSPRFDYQEYWPKVRH
jgi:hypothetical protein